MKFLHIISLASLPIVISQSSSSISTDDRTSVLPAGGEVLGGAAIVGGYSTSNDAAQAFSISASASSQSMCMSSMVSIVSESVREVMLSALAVLGSSTGSERAVSSVRASLSSVTASAIAAASSAIRSGSMVSAWRPNVVAPLAVILAVIAGALAV